MNRKLLISIGITYLTLMTSIATIQAVCLTGYVRDPLGNPVAGTDLDLIVAATNFKMPTPNDNSDPGGFYNVCVLMQTHYNVSYAPPRGTNFLGKLIYNIDLSTPAGYDTSVVLDYGIAVSGRVIDPLGAPVGDVDLDLDHITGGREYTPDDNTDLANGTYWVVVPPSTYRIRFDPPPGSRYLGFQLDSVSVYNDTLINVQLSQGNIITGSVTDTSGAGLFDVAVELRDAATGAKVFVSNNNTDSVGNYTIVVPSGLFEIRFSPPLGSRYVGERIDSVSITGDLVLNQTLQSGVIVRSTVVDTAGKSVIGADFDFKLASTGLKLFTPGDKTDDSGVSIVALLPDLYNIQIDPPIGTLFDQLIVPAVSITGDTSIIFVMPEVPRVNITGRVTNNVGVGLFDAQLDLRIIPTGNKVFLRNNATDSLGNFTLSVPVGTFTMLLAPPKGSRYVGRRISPVTFAVDSLVRDLVLDEGYLLTTVIKSQASDPLIGVDLDVVTTNSLVEIYTPYDNSDATGSITVAVPADRYKLVFTPLSGVAYSGLTLQDIQVNGDTTINVILGKLSTDDHNLKQNYPNPFNRETTITYLIPVAGKTKLTIYNSLGQQVRIFNNNYLSADLHITRWDGKNSQGENVASGIYFYELRSPAVTETKKMVLLR